MHVSVFPCMDVCACKPTNSSQPPPIHPPPLQSQEQEGQEGLSPTQGHAFEAADAIFQAVASALKAAEKWSMGEDEDGSPWRLRVLVGLILGGNT